MRAQWASRAWHRYNRARLAVRTCPAGHPHDTMTTSKLVWTHADEAPALASYALLPVLQQFTKGTGIEPGIADISLAGRIIALFPERLREDQRIADHLAELG